MRVVGPADVDKENIPTVIGLINYGTIIDMLADETRKHWANEAMALLNPSVEPTLNAAELDAVKRFELAFADEQAEKARTDLRRAVDDANTILASPRLAAIMNIRDKHLAHSLERTRREKHEPIAPMKYGDENAVLELSVPIVEQLYCWVNGKSFPSKTRGGSTKRMLHRSGRAANLTNTWIRHAGSVERTTAPGDVGIAIARAI